MDRGRGGRGGRGGDRGGGRGGRGGDRGGRGGGRGRGQNFGGNDLSGGMSQMNLDGRGRGGPRGARGARGRGRGRGGPRPQRDPNYDVVSSRPETLTDKKGTSGKAIELFTNYLGFKKKAETCLYKYRVDFNSKSQEELDTWVKKQAFERLRAQIDNFLFDGSICYLPSRIKQTVYNSSYEVGRGGGTNRVEITLRLVNELHPTDNDYVHFYNLIKQEAIEGLGLKQIKRDFFDPENVIQKPEWQVDIWPGYITTIRQHEYELLLGCQITHKILRTDSALGTMRQVMGRGGGAMRDRGYMIKKALVGNIIISTYNNKTYRIDDVDFNSSPRSTFEVRTEDGKKTTSFADYYKDRYNMTVKDLDQPLLISMPKDKDKRRGDMKAVKIIPEFAQMTGFTEAQRNNYKMMNALSEWTKMEPQKRIETLQRFGERLTKAKAVKETWSKWGMELECQPKSLKARELPPELIFLKDNTKPFNYKAENADWTNALKGGMMDQKAINKIAIVVPKALKSQATMFWSKCREVAPGLNIIMGQPLWIEVGDARPQAYVQVIEQQVYGKKPDIVVIFTNKVEDELYAVLKRLTMIKCPMLSQIITAQKILNKPDKYASFASKILVQMATKLGAKPWAVKIPPKNCMVAGFDTYHKKEGDRQAKSFGAFTASLDPIFGRYYSQALSHTAGEEISQNLPIMFAGALKAYKQVNNAYPQRIFFYRDGVGEGQLEEVRQTEIKAIKKLFEQMGEPDIKLTFIIVSKRIHTRFFTKSNPARNPNSGTVVDDVATLPERYDFYLVSQSVGVGTVNPTSYNVIHDESGWPPDKIQILTYKLTHLYYNWPGTVRVPAPCRYAHKLADLVGGSLKDEVHPELIQQNVLYYL